MDKYRNERRKKDDYENTMSCRYYPNPHWLPYHNWFWFVEQLFTRIETLPPDVAKYVVEFYQWRSSKERKILDIKFGILQVINALSEEWWTKFMSEEYQVKLSKISSCKTGYRCAPGDNSQQRHFQSRPSLINVTFSGK